MDIKDYIATIPNFPTKGIEFRDITPLLEDKDAFNYVISKMADYAKKQKADLIIGPEARGFMFACPLAYELNLGFAPVRKPGKLPRETVSADYTLEYGKNTLCLHKDAIKKGMRVLIVDDLLATGGTLDACTKLVEMLGGVVAGICTIIELPDLKGRDLLKKYDVYTMISYSGE